MQDKNVETLVSCFEKVFPKLAREEIVAATADNVENWDSLAQITLLSLVGEEFSLEVDFEEFEDATSFEKILQRIRERTADA